EGESVTLTLSGAQSYNWITAGISGNPVTVTPASAKAYDVIGTAANGCTTAAQQVIVVRPKPNIDASATPSLICAGASATISVNGADTYSWSTGSQNNTVTVSPNVSTDYIVTGTTTSNGCSSTLTVPLTVYQASISVSPVSASICPGENIQLTAGAATSWSWSTNEQQASISVSPVVTTVYTVNASTTENNLNCNGTNTVEVMVYPQPTVSATAN